MLLCVSLRRHDSGTPCRLSVRRLRHGRPPPAAPPLAVGARPVKAQRCALRLPRSCASWRQVCMRLRPAAVAPHPVLAATWPGRDCVRHVRCAAFLCPFDRHRDAARPGQAAPAALPGLPPWTLARVLPPWSCTGNACVCECCVWPVFVGSAAEALSVASTGAALFPRIPHSRQAGSVHQ